MDLEQTAVALQSQNEQLRQENDQLKSMLSVVKENIDLRARIQSFNGTLEDLTVTKPSSQWQKAADEGQFRKDLQQTRFKLEHRTSSPLNFKSFVQCSVHTEANDDGDLQSCQTDTVLDVQGLDRLLGEIAYQLDKRILYHVFRGHKRLYGFTLLNIPHKITEVSTHPLTGKVDEDYRLHLTQRHADLMERLKQFGYNTALHPPFSEFIVNTYGILKDRPSEQSGLGLDYNNPGFLRKLIMTTAPRKLQKDLLLVLTCLCYMAEKDRKPLLLC